MNNNIKTYSQAARQIGFVMKHHHLGSSEVRLLKKLIQDSYNTFGALHHDKIFLNLGLWDEKIYSEYKELNFNFSSVSEVQDINSQLLLYFLIRPLIKNQFFNKRLLDVGCGNGLGLKASAELLKTNYALGVDLVDRLIAHSNDHFYLQNKVNFIQSDAENLPLENESFDIITNLESSHLYPNIEDFFSEVERILSVGGFFCYSDHYYIHKDQSTKLEKFVKESKKLKIIQKTDITKLVQASLYQRLIVNEESFYRAALSIIGHEPNKILQELPTLAAVFGLIFLPWWKIRFKNPALQWVAKVARKDKFWGKKYYFYYLIQKVK
ncbi:class I SAM-dependent methyltransferase [Legionella londiniensis]|uniref:O-methyltransferase n=1 Tax=Legionella londiniensis TaxID=45068 RepID=A0A0W0VJR6_9GAMM|nr:class I SAM-dependent methyltransferase [Legionella londiniensis]KTD20343.1 O-methyltransferase [Legionella londiniensis]STX93946.1 O-methyltransferase [Legionella londiniensis]